MKDTNTVFITTYTIFYRTLDVTPQVTNKTVQESIKKLSSLADKYRKHKNGPKIQMCDVNFVGQENVTGPSSDPNKLKSREELLKVQCMLHRLNLCTSGT